MENTSMITALTTAAESFGTSMSGIVGDVAPIVFGVAAGIIGLRLVISLFRQAI
jgi:hypothetical protein